MVCIAGSIAQTNAFVSTRVVQTRVKLLTQLPGVVLVAPTAVRLVPGAGLTNTVPRAKANERGTLTMLPPHGHVEPQAQLAEQHVALVHGDKVVEARGQPPAGVHQRPPRPPLPGGDGAALEAVLRDVGQPDAVRPEGLVGGHEQSVSVLQLKGAHLGEGEGWLGGGARRGPRSLPTLAPVHANVLHQCQIERDGAGRTPPLE